MADFPSSPVIGDVYSVGGASAVCTGANRFRLLPEYTVFPTVDAMVGGIIPAGHRAKCVRYYETGEPIVGLEFISRGIGWPTVANGFTSHSDSKGNFLELLFGDTLDIRCVGADPTLVNNASQINAALSVAAGRTVLGAKGVFNIQAKLIVPPETKFIGQGKGFWIKKSYNGAMLDLGKWSVLENIRFDGTWLVYSGNGVEISTGDNTPTIVDQGHQRIEACHFINMKNYPIAYTVANKGWMSRVVRCTFTNYDTFSAVLWPDEPANGGNRSVEWCYSNGVIVNVGGADNGYIRNNVVGGVLSNNQGVYFPPSTANRAKKIIVQGNRFGIAGGEINIRGADIIFKDNITAGAVTLMSNSASDGCVNSLIDARILTGTFQDLSGAINYVDYHSASFTPTWTSSGTAPSFGDADVRCSYAREGDFVTVSYFIVFGSTTTFGTGTWAFSLPVLRVTGVTTDFAGSAQGRNQQLSVRTMAYSGSPSTIQLTSAAGTPVSNTVPGTWASGDTLIMDIKYRIF